jgi:hypothetical protein
MYGLSRDIDLGFLIGREVIQICVGMFSLNINFDGDATSISLECEFRVGDTEAEPGGGPDDDEPHGLCFTEAADRAKAAELLQILGAKITEVVNPGTGDLQIRFSNTKNLFIYEKKNLPYESYNLCGKGHCIVV